MTYSGRNEIGTDLDRLLTDISKAKTIIVAAGMVLFSSHFFTLHSSDFCSPCSLASGIFLAFLLSANAWHHFFYFAASRETYEYKTCTITLCFFSGNDGARYSDPIGNPGKHSNVICVGGCNYAGRRWDSTPDGQELAFLCPGENVSTTHTKFTAEPGSFNTWFLFQSIEFFRFIIVP